MNVEQLFIGFIIGFILGGAVIVTVHAAKDATIRQRHARRRRKSDAPTPRT